MDLKEVLLAQGYKKLDLDVSVGSYEEIPQLDPDLMHVKFVMCHAIENANGDTFTNEVLKAARYTPKNKPIDWEHGQPIIGHITDSEYKEDESGVGYIEATGVVYKFMYPELSSQIKEKASSGELKLSMECYFKDANYKIGEQIFDQDQAEKMGLIPYVGREYMGRKVARIFKEVIFGGVGVVAKPADKKAVFLSVAKDLGIESPEESVASIVNRSINDFTTKTHDKDVSYAVVIGKYVKAFDKAKSAVVSKFNNNSLKTKDQLMIEVRDCINTLVSEVTSINGTLYREYASEDSEVFEEKIQEAIATALNTDDQEAYFKKVEEEYVVYDIIDYSQPLKTMKASFKFTDDVLDIDFTGATEYVESEVTQEMSDIQTDIVAEEVVEATEIETPVVAEEVVEITEAAKSEDDGKDSEPDKDTDDKKGKASEETEQEIATLKSQLAEANQKIASFEARFAEIESEKIVANRLADLKDSGIEFSGNRLEKESAKLKSLSNDDYTDYKELLLEVAGKKVEVSTASKEEVEDLEDATASEVEVEEDIVVEGAKATAGLSVETPVSESRPFGHLARSK
jgi:hypothetical protein